LVVVTVNLLLVDDSLGDRLLRDLTFVNFHFHRTQSDETVNIARLSLSKSIHPVNTLDVVRWIPGYVKNHHPISCDKINSQTSSFRRYQKQSGSRIGRIVECVAPNISIVTRRRPVQAEIVQTETPRPAVTSNGIGLASLGGVVDSSDEILDNIEGIKRLRKHESEKVNCKKYQKRKKQILIHFIPDLFTFFQDFEQQK
jgi:hypothetical protein